MPAWVKDEQHWKEAKKQAAKEGHARDWPYIAVIYKRMTGMQKSEKLVGGRADGLPDSDFDPRALAQGVKVEMEHTKDPKVAKEIAKDHLRESATYYNRLRRMEQNMGKSSSSSMMTDLDSLVKSAEQEDTLSKAKQMGLTGMGGGGGGHGKKGEGSRGGHVVGHTKGGDPIYAREGLQQPGEDARKIEHEMAHRQHMAYHKQQAEAAEAAGDKESSAKHKEAFVAHNQAEHSRAHVLPGRKEDTQHAYAMTDAAHGSEPTSWQPGHPLPSRSPGEGPGDNALREHHAGEQQKHEGLATAHAKSAAVRGMPHSLSQEHKLLASEHGNISEYHRAAASGKGYARSDAIGNSSHKWLAESEKLTQRHMDNPLPKTFHETSHPAEGESPAAHEEHHMALAEAHAHRAARNYLQGDTVAGDKHARAAEAHDRASHDFYAAGGGRFAQPSTTTMKQAHESAQKAHKATDDAYDPDVKKSIQQEPGGDVLSKTMVTKQGKEQHFAQVEAAIRGGGGAADPAAVAAKIYHRAGGTTGEPQPKKGKGKMKKASAVESPCMSKSLGEALVKDGLLLMTDGCDELLSKAMEAGEVGLGLSPTIPRLSMLPAENQPDMGFPRGQMDDTQEGDANGGLNEWWHELDLGRREVVLPPMQPAGYVIEETNPFVLEQQLRDEIRNR
jgi:hypothetical protein